MRTPKTPGELAASLRTMFAARVPHVVMPGQGPAWSIVGNADRLYDLQAAAQALDDLASAYNAQLQALQFLPDGTVRPVFCGADCVDEGLCRDTQSCDRVGTESVGRVNVEPTRPASAHRSDVGNASGKSSGDDSLVQLLIDLGDQAQTIKDLLSAPSSDLNLSDRAVQKRLAAQWGFVEPPAAPVAWLRNLTDAQPHAVRDLRYRSVADVDDGVEYVPVYVAPVATDGEKLAREAHGYIREQMTAWDRENLHDCIDKLAGIEIPKSDPAAPVTLRALSAETRVGKLMKDPEFQARLREELREVDASVAAALADPVAQPVSAAEEFDAPASCPAREAMGEHACQDRAQCWEPCGALGQSAAHVTVSKDYAPAPGVESEGGEG